MKLHFRSREPDTPATPDTGKEFTGVSPPAIKSLGKDH